MVSKKYFHHAIEKICGEIGTAIREHSEPLKERIRELETAVPQYRGTYKAGQHYTKNSIITDHGALWIALSDIDTRPPGDAWQMCVSRGR